MDEPGRDHGVEQQRAVCRSYDALNRPLSTIGAYGTSAEQVSAAQAYGYLSHAVATLSDANGNVTAYEYDGHERLVKIRFPNASGGGSSVTDYEQYTYDAGSNVTLDRRRDGATIGFAYDNLSRPTTMTPWAGAAVSTAYDNFSRATSIATAGTHTLSFVYDQLSRATSATRVANGATQTVSYQYDLAGRRTRVSWPDGFYAQYDYDVAGAVVAIRENGASSGVGVLAAYAYDNYGRRTSVTRGNGTATTYAYDAASLLASLTQDLASSASDQSQGFTYNSSGQALTRTGTNAAYVWAQPAPSTDNSTANGRNQLASLNGANFSYDGRGNLTSDGARTFAFDVYNRLTSVSGAASLSLSYDPAGRLYETTTSGVTTRFLYDGAGLIAEYNASGAMLRRYVRGPGVDETIVWYEGAGTSDRRWLHQDRTGSTIAVSNASGAASEVHAYDEYGRPDAWSGARLRYTGQMMLPEAQLYHYRTRAYDPALGRFLQSDPILYAGGMNVYAYVGNDPVNWVDPTGLQQGPEQDGGGGGSFGDWGVVRSGWSAFVPVPVPGHPGCFEDNDTPIPEYWCEVSWCDAHPRNCENFRLATEGMKVLTLIALDWVGVSLDSCPASPERSLSPDYVEVQVQLGNVKPPGTNTPLSAGGQVTIDRFGRIYTGSVATVSRTPASASVVAGYLVASPEQVGGTPSGAALEQFLTGASVQGLASPDGVGGGATVSATGSGVAINGGLITPGASVSGGVNQPPRQLVGSGC